MPNESDKKQCLKELIIKRASTKGQITKFKNYLSGISIKSELNNVQLTELNLKLAKFEALSVRFDDLQNDIEVLSPENISVEIDERENIEHEIIINIATAKTLVDKFTRKVECEHTRHGSFLDNSCRSENQESGLKLPRIEIAKFDGAYFRWLEFRDTFESLIHKNSHLSDIHKFHYLISYLVGDAARIISNLEVSSANYSEAWNLLCSRYDNKRILINHHLNSLFSFKQIPRESERSLRFLVDHVTKNLRALASLGQPTDKWDVLIIFMLSAKLDSTTLTKWEEHRNNLDGDTPTLEQFFKFMIDRADVLETLNRSSRHDASGPKPHVNSARSNSAPHDNYIKQQSSYTKSFSTTAASKFKKLTKVLSCIICNDNHRIYDCPTFKSKGIDERMDEVKKYKLCANCLRQGHIAKSCRLRPCYCGELHNNLLHNPNTTISHPAAMDEADDNSDNKKLIVTFSKQNSRQILLSTAIIEVTNPLIQQKVKVRALLDCGSQMSFISKSLKNKLNLKTRPIDSLKVIGIGNHISENVSESCNIQINSTNSNFSVQLSCLVLNELTGEMPKYPVNVDSLNLPMTILLADPKLDKQLPIDILIGADLFWDILGTEQISLGPGKPQLRNSHLGWLLSGPVGSMVDSKATVSNSAFVSKLSSEDRLEDSLAKFWDLEQVPTNHVLNEKDKLCEQHFVTHTRRDDTGRFCVRLPLNDTLDCLGDTYKLARKRFYYLERRFKRNPDLKGDYTNFIHEYEALGHLSLAEVKEPENQNGSTVYYLCHHAVHKEDSESTRLRVVFDASAPSSSGFALNDILMIGPRLQDSLFAILIRARQYKFLFTGDIEKMYRQVLVDEQDRDLQRILWRDDESLPIRIFKLNTLTYGTASASYLSTRCLWQLGEEQNDKLISDIIQKDFYVDDLITGADNERDLIHIQQSVDRALRSGCFNLRKYKSNMPAIFENIDINKQDNLTISESSSTLGLGWIPSSDTLHFPTKLSSKSQKITKRTIMSNSFKIFDPLGLLSPCIIQAKMMLQKLWKAKLDWDDPVPDDIKVQWHKFDDNLSNLSQIQIPRRTICDSPVLIELHSFSDASEVAFGACVYVRSVDQDHKITVRLLCAKSKVARLQPTTIPRLELCAAVLAGRLTKTVLDSIRYTPDRIFYWCDSQVVLGWLNGDPTKLKTFVANRVGEIMETTKVSSWRYVPTECNPADLISRGVDAKRLMTMDIWWSGSGFLSKNETEWPTARPTYLHVDKLPEVKSHSATIKISFIDFNKYSSLNRLQGSYAYVLRFIFNLKHPQNKRVGVLTVDELRESFHLLCIMAQRDSFPVEYDLLIKGKSLSSKSKILMLSPFIDKDNLMRVGGRIEASNCTFEKKHPILLHGKHRLSKLYFEREHINSMHAGPQLLLATVREVIWPINGRQLARRTTNSCVRCRRVRGKTLCPKMGDLPAQRINPDFPFLSVGIDFAGPFAIINRKGRGSRVIKCYLCLFVCLRYKCIHLEAVSDLTKDAFVMTLRRFIARRGKPVEILCDNGRNFVAAAKEIGNFIMQNVEPLSDFASQQGIKFRFIPAYAPHFGGVWEAGVKSAKFHIKRVVGNSHLTFEEISTLFAQVEAILNSRPLCPLSSCPSDLLSLTPGHFIIGRPLTALPSPAPVNCSDNQRKRYERLESIRHHFWQRWQKEYLSELQQRTKWRNNTARLSIGDMVLLSEDCVPPLCWRLGRVVNLIPGPDGVARVADVQTTKGCVRRTLTRLCPLPTADELKS